MTFSVVERLENARGGYQPKDYSVHPRIAEQRILIASDVHIPYHDIYTVAKLFAVAETYKVEAIVWLGDVLDNPAFSTYDKEDLDTRFDDELEQVEQLLTIGSEYVGRQYWSRGNHEVRWPRMLKFQAGMRRLAMMAGGQKLMEQGRLVVSDDPTWEYTGDDGSEWMLTHPKQYGRVPLVVPGRIADRYQKNIISAHAHHWAQGRSESGKYQVIESGGLFEPRYHQYIQWQITDHRAWLKGFVLLDHGVATPFPGAE